MRPHGRRRRWLIAIGLSILLLLGAVFAVLRIQLEGAALGDNVASILNKRMRGRIEIGSIEWSSSELEKVVTGGWVPIRIHDVRVWDDCALSAGTTGLSTVEADELRTGDPNEDCTPDDHPDPDPASKRKPRKLLLRTDLVTADIDIHALFFGNHDFVFRSVWVHGGDALLEQTREPYPMHAYDRTIVSIVTAFYPRMKPGFRAGIYADNPPPIFDLRDIHVEGLSLTVHMTPYSQSGDNIGYGMTARLEGVDVDSGPTPKNDSFLYMDPTDPLIAKFYVRLGVTAKRGKVRILDEGPRQTFRMTEIYPPPVRKAKYDLELTDVELKRLAQMPTEWPRHDYVANTLELDLLGKTVPCDAWKTKEALAQDLGVVTEEIDRQITAGRISVQPQPDGTTRYSDSTKRSELHLKGEINGYWDRPYDGSWNLALDAKNLGPTVRSCIKSTAGGDHLNAAITLTGPFVALPKVGLELHDLDVDVPLRRGEDPLRLTLAEVHGSVDLVNDQGVIEKTKALVRGGREPGEVELSAIFAIKPYSANASIEIVKPIDVTRFLPKAVLPAGHLIAGRMRARGDVDVGFALEDFDLSLGQSATDKALRVHQGRIFTNDDFDTIKIENVNVEAGANHAMFTGDVNTDNGKVDVWIDGRFPDLDIWLKRFQLPQLFKSAGRATAGPGGGGGGGNGGIVHVTGTITKPRVDINTELAGVPCLDKLRVYDTRYENNILDIGSLTSEGLGGKLTGKARIRLGGAQPYIESMHLNGRDLDVAKVCGLAGIAKGTIDTAELDLHGSVDKNRGVMDWLDLVSNAQARADHLTVMATDGYSNIRVCVNRKDDASCRAPGHNYLDGDDLAQCDDAKKRGGFCVVATASRDAGGMLDATIAKIPAKKPVPAHLGGTIALADLPMALLDRFAGKSVTGGLFSTTLHLSGTPSAPQATGAIQLLRTWALGAFLGDPQLAVEPGSIRGMPGLRVKGTAMMGRVAITGVIGTAPPYPVEIQLSGRRIELDPFVDLTAMVGSPDPVQAWVTGTVTLKTELAPAGGKAPEADAWIELSELQGVVTHRSADGHRTPLRLSVIDESPQTRAAVSLHVTNRSIELACRDAAHPGTTMPCATKVATPAGVLVIQGHANETEIALSADTTADHPLELALLAPLVDNQFDEVSGHLQVHASIAGTFDKPTFVTELDIDTKGGIKLRPSGGDVELAARSGQIRLANGSLGFNGVQLLIDDPHRPNEQGLLTIHGGIGLDGLTPTTWGLILEGKIAGKMLLVAAPGLVASASGLASIGEDGLRLYGRGRRPLVAGTVVFDQQPLPQQKGEAAQAPPSPLAIFPRGVHRELAFVQGSVDIATCAPDSHERDCPRVSGDHRAYLFYINDVDVSVDGEGRISNISGPTNGPAVTLVDGAASRAYVTFDADNVPYQTLDRTIDLTLGAKQMVLRLDRDQAPWEVQGEITVVGGNYKRNFELTDQITQLGVTEPPTKPFWEEYPTIGSARLENIRVNVNRFNINNNIAQILLAGGLEITGTPRDPRLRGQITVDRGSFRIPGTRADFTRTSGSVDFSENDPAANPALKLQSIADYRDLSGQDHEITLKITNHLDHLEWDLTTSTGYDKSQTLALLVLGRNPEQLRRSLGDQALGGDPTRFDPSTNPSQGFTDQIVKDLAGDWVSDLLGSSLTKLTGFDVLRIEIGFGSLDIHVEKKVLDNIKLLGDQEWTIRGKTLNGRVEVQTPWRIFTSEKITGQVGYLNKDFYDPAEQDINDVQAKLVYKLFIP